MLTPGTADRTEYSSSSNGPRGDDAEKATPPLSAYHYQVGYGRPYLYTITRWDTVSHLVMVYR
ncbi:uncharacterized protein CPUR_05397 [Claviceps purpurea 20.1]|uniref:Uncharacterized protein n=1 Tax=Claviceps purpurea (strain 20.1) TaxID=1111077 RepID=M1WG83_CLAP2|nr:uncharacterized protein CPUR_05397 [Claviceps purpurea 20.1]